MAAGRPSQRKREIRNSFGRQKSRTRSTNQSFDSDCRFKNCFDGGAKRRQKSRSIEAIGMATYSNNESTVLTYISIFETLWAQAELKPTNMRALTIL